MTVSDENQSAKPALETDARHDAALEQRYQDTLRAQDGLAQALQAAEERFNVLFRESSDVVLLLTPTGAILSANTCFERYTATAASDWFREEKGWTDCIHEVDWPLFEGAILRCAKQMENQIVEARLLSGDGFYQWFEWSLSPLYEDQAQARGMVVVARNIHRRKELETQWRDKAQDLQKRHERAQVMIAKMKHFFARTGSLPTDAPGYYQGVCEILNEMYQPMSVCLEMEGEQQSAYSAGRTPGQPPCLLPKSLREAVVKAGLPFYQNTLNLTDPFRGDPDVRRQGLITFLGAPLRDAAGQVRGILAIMDSEKQYYDNIDVELITVAALHLAARLRAEEQDTIQRALEDHLRQAQKMEAVGLLAGGIAHDFNNILSGILGFSSYLLSKVDAESTLHRDLKLIEQSAVRASELTRQLLAFARRKHFAKEAVSMNKIIEEILILVRRSFGKHIQIREKLDPALPLVHGDPGQLHQVIMNLCLNASEAMREMESGTLFLHTESRPLTPRERTILGEQSNQPFVCVIISDDGMGMSDDIQEHIYEPFYTTKSEEGGSGLGLSIVYGIVNNHGGHVLVDSARNEGAVFTIYLPVYEGVEQKEAELGPIALTGSETVLVIDDEPIVRQMAAEVLRGNGYKVVTAEGGMEALRYMDELRGRIDLVLLDMIMPTMDGEATFKALRRIDPDLSILLTSGFVQEGKTERLINDGALGMVHKPYKSEKLLRAIRSALDLKKRA